MRPIWCIYPNAEAVGAAAAEHFVALGTAAHAARGQFTVALSGGSTPRHLYSLLAEEPFRDQVAWPQVHVFWSDERYVPADSPQSNYRMAHDLLLRHVPVVPDHVHRVCTEEPPAEAALEYSHALSDVVGDDGLDLVLLGMGEDGHVASIFPGTQAERARRRGAVAQFVRHLGAWRITLTLPEINHAGAVMFAVTGARKADVVASLSAGGHDLPAAHVRPRNGRLIWLLDAAAASRTPYMQHGPLAASPAGPLGAGAAAAPGQGKETLGQSAHARSAPGPGKETLGQSAHARSVPGSGKETLGQSAHARSAPGPGQETLGQSAGAISAPGDSVEALKQSAGAAAAELVESGMIVGLGTGSTARHATLALAARLARGEIRDVVAVPTSEDTARLARANGIELTTLEANPDLDLAIDGADEIAPNLDLVKGLGGALAREKVVATAARRFVVVADASKRVAQLGTSAPLPLAVLPFGWSGLVGPIRDLGAEPTLRTDHCGQPCTTDDGLFLLDCRFPNGIAEPRALDRALHDIPGVFETGLFLGLAAAAYVAEAGGVQLVERE